MTRLGHKASIALALLAAFAIVGGGLVPSVAAAEPDPSDVVIVFDFSASILNDRTTRNQFAAAIGQIADRVDATSADLVAGDATVSIVQFASRARDWPKCANLKLLNSQAAVTQFGSCLRSVAAAYRKGRNAGLTRLIGDDTNYVAAMNRAAVHLPADSIRPAMILFTDGRHDVPGVPASQVQPTFQRLFGSRTPFAFLPVGMGLDPALRGPLAAGLERLRVIREMPACVSGAIFDWPQVVFQTAAEAGNAVAVALQEATCTFTAGPAPSPTPTPTPAAAPGPVGNIRLTPGDGRIDLVWTFAAAGGVPPVDFAARCRAGAEAPWIESTEGVSLDAKTTVEGLTNGTAYQCEVAAIGAGDATGPWSPAGATVTPVGKPAAPSKPAVAPGNAAVVVTVPLENNAGVAGYHVECSSDDGATWSEEGDADPDVGVATVGGLVNGGSYVCRAFAKNATGLSDASPVSDAVRPCGSIFECNPIAAPAVGGLLGLMILGILISIFMLLRGRPRGHVVAVVDVVHTANIGHGPSLGIGFMRQTGTRTVTGIVADRGPQADLRIRRLRNGRFVVTDTRGRHEVSDGEAIVVVDNVGVRHSLVLRAFATNAASEVASRR